MIRYLTASLAFIARVLPEAWVIKFGAGLGWAWHSLVPIRRGLVRNQMRTRLGVGSAESEILARAMFRHLGISVAELFRHGTVRGLAPRLRVEGEAHLLDALREGRGVVALTAHLGNWEILSRYGAGLERPLSIVTRRLSVGPFQGMWEHLRDGGPSLLSADGGGREVIKALQRGEIVGFVLDQHAPENGAMTLDFLGAPAATSTGLVRAARLTGAPIVPLFTWREGDTHVISIGASFRVSEDGPRALAIRDATERCIALLEAAIRAHPEQWLWLHRRWKVAIEDRPEAETFDQLRDAS